MMVSVLELVHNGLVKDVEFTKGLESHNFYRNSELILLAGWRIGWVENGCREWDEDGMRFAD
jgi:hypothetical protein